MKYGSICSGIEAASVAWEPLGWECEFVSEIEPFPCHVLHHRFGASRPLVMPDPGEADTDKERRSRENAIKAVSSLPETGLIPNAGDFTKIESDQYGSIDLLVGGTPCQSFSLAGLRGGLGDDRGNLALEFLRLAERTRANWVVWENVPGVLSSNGGRDFGAILGGLVKLGYGYAYRILDAQYIGVDGYPMAVPQRRRRVFVVGYIGDYRRAAAVLFERESLSGNSAPRRESGKSFAAGALRGTNGGSDVDHGIARHLVEAAPVASTLNTAYGTKQGLEDQHVNSGCPLFVTFATDGQAGAAFSEEIALTLDATHEAPYIAAAHEEIAHVAGATTSLTSHNGQRNEIADAGSQLVAHTLRGEGRDATEDGTGKGTPIIPVVAFTANDYGADATEDIAPTLRAGGHQESHANAGVVPAIAFPRFARNGRGAPDVVAAPLTAQAGETGKGDSAQCVAFDTAQITSPDNRSNPQPGDPMHTLHGGSTHTIADTFAVRRLTPIECERLQGFPDNHTLIPWRGRPAEDCPDGPRYKAIGNSKAINAVRWLGMRIDMVEKIFNEMESK